MDKIRQSLIPTLCWTFLFLALPGAALAQADLVLSKDTIPPGEPTMLAGGELRYRVTVTNQGPDPAINLQITDDLFDIFQQSQPSSGASCSEDLLGVGFARRVTCSWAGATAVGQQRSIDFTVRSCGGTACNFLLVADVASSSSDTTDPDPSNNSQVGVGGSVPAVVTEVLTQTSFGTTAEANRDSAAPGEQVTYTIVVSNQGPSSTPETTVTHRLPLGWTVDSLATGSGFPANCSGVGSRTARCVFALQSPFICAAFAPGEETVTVVANVSGSEVPGIRSAVTTVSSSNCLEDLGDTNLTTSTRVTGPADLHFSQFGGGGGFTSDIVLTNPSPAQALDGVVFFYDVNGLPLEVFVAESLALGPISHLEFSIPPLGGTRFSTSSDQPLSLGSASVNASREVGGVIRFGIPGIGIAGVGSSQPLRRAIVPVRQMDGIRTGLAIRNLASGNNLVALSLRTFGGVEIPGGVGSVALQENGRAAAFIDELFGSAETEGFEGVVVIESLGQIAVIAQELGDDPGEFTTLPVTEISISMVVLEEAGRQK